MAEPQSGGTLDRLMTRIQPLIGPVVILIVFAAVGYAIKSFLAHIAFKDVVEAITATPMSKIALALAVVGGAYVSLTGYDWSAMRYIGVKLPYRRIALGAFCGYAVGNTAGFMLVTGGSVRYRIYAADGLSASQIAIVTVFTMLSFGIGVMLIGGTGLMLRPELVAGTLHGSSEWLRLVGIATVLGCAGLVVLSYWRQAPIRYKGISLRLPSPSIMLGQIVISACEMSLAALSLYVLLPEAPGLDFLGFAVIYCAAMMIGVSTHVPGAVGVFEAVVIFALKETVPLEALAAALVLWRCLYFFVPLIVASLLLALHEIAMARRGGPSGAGQIGAVGLDLAPPVLACLIFAAGLSLIIATQIPGGLKAPWLAVLAPLALVEASHLLSSVLGLVLLVLAHGLHHRLNAAFWLTLATLVLGLVLLVMQDAGLVAITFFALVLCVLLACRRAFHRPTSLLDQRPEPVWIAALLGAVGGALWLGRFALGDIDYGDVGIWSLALDGDVPRAARAGAAAATLALILGLITLLRPPRHVCAEADALVRTRYAGLAKRFGGDPFVPPEARVIFAGSDRAALAFMVEGRHWRALGDPVGPYEAWQDLIWDFRERAEAAGAHAGLIQASPRGVEAYRAAGLYPQGAHGTLGTFAQAFKLGPHATDLP